MGGNLFVPDDLQRDVFALQLAVNRRPCLGLDPTEMFISAAAAVDLARDSGKDVRNIVRDLARARRHYCAELLRDERNVILLASHDGLEHLRSVNGKLKRMAAQPAA